MRRYVKFLTPMLWVVAFALLAVRTADAHVHLCLDGQEPRAELHLSDGLVCHQSENSNQKHNDQDVDAVGAQSAKKAFQAEDLVPLVPFTAIVLFRITTEWTLLPHEATTQDPAPRLPDLFLPLHRGPPV